MNCAFRRVWGFVLFGVFPWACFHPNSVKDYSWPSAIHSTFAMGISKTKVVLSPKLEWLRILQRERERERTRQWVGRVEKRKGQIRFQICSEPLNFIHGSQSQPWLKSSTYYNCRLCLRIPYSPGQSSNLHCTRKIKLCLYTRNCFLPLSW